MPRPPWHPFASMKRLAAVLALAVLSACAVVPPEKAVAPTVQPSPPSRVADDPVPTPGAVPVMVWRPEDELANCVDKNTRRLLAAAKCNGGTAVANDPPGTRQIPMMIYRRADGLHFCINYLNMEVLPSWRCT